MRPVYLGVLLLTLFIGACGFKLKGPVHLSANFSPLYIHSVGADTIAIQVKQSLIEQQIVLTDDATQAKAGLVLQNERVDRRVLSVSAVSGRLEEVELNHRVEVSAIRPDGSELLGKQVISLVRDFTFDETAVLAKGAEEAALREDLRREVLSQVLRVVDSLAHLDT